MSLKNKIKNIKIFGIKSYLPHWKYQLIIGIVFVAVFFFLSHTFTTEDNIQLTGLAIQDTKEPNNQILLTEETEKPEQITEKEQNKDYEVYEYFEYKGECAFDIKNIKDDIGDIANYKDKNKEKLEKAKDEYENKLNALKDEYEIRIDDLEENCDQDQISLQEAQQKLKDLQEQCAF